MKSINIAQMLVIPCLLVGIINSEGLTVTGPNIPPGIPTPEGVMTWINLKLSIPSMPRVGEVFNVEFTISCINDLENTKFGPDYTVTFSSNTATILTGKEYKYSGYMKKGEVKKFAAKMVINKAEPSVSIKGIITGDKRGWPPQDIGFVIFLVDEETGQYGTNEEYNRQLYKTSPQWFYDAAGEFTNGGVSPDAAAENLKIIARIKQLNPDLTDWEALYLHYDGIQALMGGMGNGKTSWEDRWRFLLDMGWLEKQRQGKEIKDKWLKEIIEKYKGKSLKKEQGLNPIFFRGDSSSIADNRGDRDSSQTRWDHFLFKGQFRYKKHLYNKDQGLLTQTEDMPICSVLVRVRAYWLTQGTIWTSRTSTDANGNFRAILNHHVPVDSNIYAHPMVYFWGPESANLIIKVSDPTPIEYPAWRDPLDQTIFLLPRVQAGVDTIWTSTDSFDFHTMYIDSFISGSVPQPKSGAANINQVCLHARTLAFINPPPSRPLRVMWDTGYDFGSAMNMLHSQCNDTIWIKGNTALNGPDEWDDDQILHEFGHYLMKSYAEGPPSDTGSHTWSLKYPERPGLAYGEGWANIFSCRARAGYSTDSIIVNTKGGIGSGLVGNWRIIENPWLGSDYDTTQFEASPWCEGAVAGALWDIYDSHNEDPYHSYPDTLHGFPDIGLRDTLTMGFDPIWNVFDNYDPSGTPTKCWTIFHFRSGWNYYNYDHAFALNQILLHHRIRDTIPAAPTGLSARSVLGDVRLYWHKNSEPDLQGYRVFRRDSTIMNPTPGWTSWALLVEKNTDTTHLDTTTVIGAKYRYRLTAFDSLGNESGYSDSVSILVRGKGDIDKQPPFGLTKTIVRNNQGIEFFIPEGRKEVSVRVYDCCGRIVLNQQIHVERNNLCEISLKNSRFDHLPSGVYFLSLETDKADKIVEKFVIMK